MREIGQIAREGRGCGGLPSASRIAAPVAVLALTLAFPPAALANHTVTDYGLSVASTQAGASANASSWTSLSYGTDQIEDVKKTVGHFAPGMVANPEAVPHCPQAQYLADACPADTLIGSAEAIVNGAVVEPGRIYNQELRADEAGRLGIIVDSATGKLFLTAPFYVRTNGDYGLDGLLDDIPRLTPAAQITKLSFTLFGTVQGRNFTRAPTSCSLKVSTGEAYGYEHKEAVSGPSSSYTPTGCDKLPFKPTFDMSVGSRGTTELNDNPPLRVRVSQQPGEAGVLANGVTLPVDLTPDTGSFDVICSDSQLSAGTCPAGSRVGSTTATSPFVATPLSGPVWLVQKPGSVLPALVADLRGRVPVKVTIATAIIGGRQIKSTVTGVPDLPIGTFTLSLDGGPEGVLTNKTDLCENGSKFRELKAGVTFGAHSGAATSSNPRIEVEGCKPIASGSLRRGARARPRLSVRVRRHPDAEGMKRVELVLPKELRVVRGKVRRNISAHAPARLARSAVQVRSSRKINVSGLPSAGAGQLVVKLSRGAVRASPKLRRALRRAKRKTLRVKVVTTDVTGARFTSRASVSARR